MGLAGFSFSRAFLKCTILQRLFILELNPRLQDETRPCPVAEQASARAARARATVRTRHAAHRAARTASGYVDRPGLAPFLWSAHRQEPSVLRAPPQVLAAPR